MKDNAAVTDTPRLLVFSSLFPHQGRPNAGLFIRERMFRVGQQLPIVVVAPVPWFPLQGILRKFRPHFRPPAPRFEVQDGVEVYYPRFLCVPGLFKTFDGFFMAIGSFMRVRKLRQRFGFNLIDAHFAYPDGYAATLLGRWFKAPVTITLRGTEVPHAKTARRSFLVKALRSSARVFSVADSLKQFVVSLGIDAEHVLVVGNGVDTKKFYALNKRDTRETLNIPDNVPVLISVGGLVERKGFHRVIECLPALVGQFPGLLYLVIGGASAEGDWGDRLKQQVKQLGLEKTVRFLGAMPPEQLKTPLSSADVFVLATSNEGWANVFLEAMACALPVVTTRVGGNAEAVANSTVGLLVPFGDSTALEAALAEALSQHWDREAIVNYANNNTWDKRISLLVNEYYAILNKSPDRRRDAHRPDAGAQ